MLGYCGVFQGCIKSHSASGPHIAINHVMVIDNKAAMNRHSFHHCEAHKMGKINVPHLPRGPR